MRQNVNWPSYLSSVRNGSRKKRPPPRKRGGCAALSESASRTVSAARKRIFIFSLALGPHPQRELTLTPHLGFAGLGSVWPQALLSLTPYSHREPTLTPRRGFAGLGSVWPPAPLRSLPLSGIAGEQDRDVVAAVSFDGRVHQPVGGALKVALR